MQRWLLCSYLLALLGCGADKNYDDYRKALAAEELGKVSKFSGLYRGELYSKAAQKTLGQFEVELEPGTNLNFPSELANPSQRVMLKGKLRLANSVFVAFSDGFYDGDTGRFQGTIPLERRNGDKVSVEISGVLEGDNLTGRVEAFGFSEFGGDFKLSKIDQATSKPIMIASDPKAKPGTVVPMVYVGEYAWKNSSATTPSPSDSGTTPSPVTLVITQHQETSDETFLSLLTPLRLVDVTINFSKTFPAFYLNSRWDIRNGTIEGKSKVGGLEIDEHFLPLSCKAVQVKTDQIGWNCRHTNTISGEVIEISFFALA